MQKSGNFTVYKSSAGSGKTYTLVREYIVIALKSPYYFKSILAITFTNKAASEMKQRVITSLMHMANPLQYAHTPTVKFMMPEIAFFLDTPIQELSEKCNDVLTNILHRYDDFAIKTIDSFVSKIIRTFAHDLHLPVDFEIELEHNLLLDKAVANVIDRIGVDKELTGLLLAYANAKMDDDKSWNIALDLKKTGTEVFEERSIPFLEELKKYTPDKIKEISRNIHMQLIDIENYLQHHAMQALKLIKDNNISAESFANGKTGITSFFKYLNNKQVKMPTPTVIKNIENDKWYAGKCENWQKQAIDVVKDQLKHIYNICTLYLNENYTEYILLKLIERNIYQIGVLAEIQKQVEAISRENSIVHISEFNKRITEIILKEPVPFVYERIGERYHHYLIDEFQDTSELQWKNLLPLIGDTLASGNYNLIVGDGKQAIYRFRNGNVEQFMLLPQLPENFEPHIFKDTENSIVENFLEKELNVNYRSKFEIVNFNNNFFNYLIQFIPDRFSTIYNKLSQQTLPANLGGFVQIEFFERQEKTKVSTSYLESILNIIKNSLDKGFALGDISILIQKKAEGNIIAQFLTANNIPVVSSEALLLSASAKVNFLISVLKYLHDKQNLLAVAEILTFLQQNQLIDIQLIENISKKNDFYLETFLQEHHIHFNTAYLYTFSLYDMSEEIIRIFGLQKPYDIYIQRFLDFVNETHVRVGNKIDGFLQEWEDNKANLSIQLSSELDAVKIMTIHKSKGLEFPIVILPVSQNEKPPLKNKWAYMPDSMKDIMPVAYIPFSKDLANTELKYLYQQEMDYETLDKINVAYVACTRAVDCLYVLATEQKDKKQGDETLGFNRFFQKYVQENTDKFEISDNAYFIGNMPVRQKNITTIDVPKEEPVMQSSSWRDKITIARSANVEVHNAHLRTGQAWGSIVHESIAYIDFPLVIEDIVAKQAKKYIFSEQEKKILEIYLNKVINHPFLQEYFKEGLETLSETAILDIDGNEFRPDRVVITTQGLAVIEFKTGIPAVSHAAQLENYAYLLTQMKYAVAEKLLVYLGNDEINVEKL